MHFDYYDVSRDTLKQQALNEIRDQIQPALAELAEYIQQVTWLHFLSSLESCAFYCSLGIVFSLLGYFTLPVYKQYSVG